MQGGVDCSITMQKHSAEGRRLLLLSLYRRGVSTGALSADSEDGEPCAIFSGVLRCAKRAV